MKIGIDARLYGLQHAGIGRYVMNLIQHLQNLDPTNQYVLFLRAADYSRLNLPSNWQKILANIPHYSFQEQWSLPQLIKSAQVDLMHFPHFNVPWFYHQPFVVTIHDLLWHQIKGLSVTSLNPVMYLVKYLGYRLVVSHALRRSVHILVPSHWVAQQLKTDFDLPSAKITVTYEGITATFAQPPDTTAAEKLIHKLKLHQPFLVYTGSAYPHKNLRLLLSALQRFHRQGQKLNLAIVSSRSVFLDQLKTLVHRQHLQDQIVFTGFLTDQDLRSVYSQATALVHPSLSEGFGLTGLEAMAAGLPVISANTGSLPEIYEDAALYFNPYSQDELVAQINRILTDPNLRQRLVAQGQRLTGNYNWHHTAQKTLEVYQKVL